MSYEERLNAFLARRAWETVKALALDEPYLIVTHGVKLMLTQLTVLQHNAHKAAW